MVNEVNSVHPNFFWLSYAPKQIVIHGLCTDVDKVVMNIDNDLGPAPEDEFMLDYPGTVGLPAQCLKLYRTSPFSSKTVQQIVSANNAAVGTARAEPNFYASGFMGAYAIYGSPAAMFPNAPMTSTSGTTPLTGITTGDNVGVYVFDTSPYGGGPTVFTETIKGKSMRVKNVPNFGGALFSGIVAVQPNARLCGTRHVCGNAHCRPRARQSSHLGAYDD